VCKRLQLRDYPALELLLVWLWAYASYTLALGMHLSGVMALFVCGLVLRHYNWHNLSVPCKTLTRYGFHALGLFCEMAVFVYLGVTLAFSLTPAFNLRWTVSGCIVTFLLVWVARALYVFPLSWLANLRRRRPLTGPMQCIVFAGGLRGAVSFALALNVQGPHADVMVTSCLCVVVATSLLGGASMDKVVRHCSMRMRQQHSLLPSSDNPRPDEDNDADADACEGGEGAWSGGDSGEASPVGVGAGAGAAEGGVFTIEEGAAVMETSAMNKVLAQAQWGSLNQVWDTFDAGVMRGIFGGPGGKQQDK
jgi:NhaP-type Na+/H+ and K+/H+ antiporter